MKKIICILTLLFALSSVGHATTWYVRLDGGTSLQCTGTTNAPYSGGTSVQWKGGNNNYTLGQQFVDSNNNLEQVTVAGTSAANYPPTWNTTTGGTTTDNTATYTNEGPLPSNQACAVNDITWLTTTNKVALQTPVWVPTSGDVIQYEDLGPYTVGSTISNSGFGSYWLYCITTATNCVLPPLPNGVSLYGKNKGNCNNWPNGPLNPTVLTASNAPYYMLSVQGSSGNDIECLEITQPDTCTNIAANTLPYGVCATGTNNFSHFGIVFQTGTNQGPANLTLKDIAIVGMGDDGIIGSHLNVLSTDTVTMSDVYLIGNGATGWSGDGGGCGTSCETVGNVNGSYINASWNGCVAVKPYDITVSPYANGYNWCNDDNSAVYGNGDAIALIASGAATYTFDHMYMKYNVQDGLDTLHTGDDTTHSPNLTVTDSWAEGNMGQTFKIGKGTFGTAINNISIANCKVMKTAANFPLNPSGWNSLLSDFCRAAGDQWALSMKDGEIITLQFNTSVGYGTTMYDVSCGGCTSNTANIVFQDNISKGYPDPNTGVLASGFYFDNQNVFANAGSLASYNLWSTISNGCPNVTGETNYLCPGSSTAIFTQQSNIDAFNPNLITGSPAIYAGLTISGITKDYAGNTRNIPPSMGALEFESNPSTTAYISGSATVGGAASIQ